MPLHRENSYKRNNTQNIKRGPWLYRTWRGTISFPAIAGSQVVFLRKEDTRNIKRLREHCIRETVKRGMICDSEYSPTGLVLGISALLDYLSSCIEKGLEAVGMALGTIIVDRYQYPVLLSVDVSDEVVRTCEMVGKGIKRRKYNMLVRGRVERVARGCWCSGLTTNHRPQNNLLKGPRLRKRNGARAERFHF